MFLKLIGLLIIATIIKSEAYDDKYVDYHSHPKYTYSYGVEDFKTGDYKMHKEERDGDVVKGEYRVADPNGSIRTVTYTADKEHGFQAVVKQSESIELPHILKENHDAVADHIENKESASAHYNYYYDKLSTQSKPDDSKQQTYFRHTPSSNIDKYVDKFTDDSGKKDQLQNQEIKKMIYPNNKYISHFKYNHQDDSKYEIETPKTQYLATAVDKKKIQEIEDLKQYPKFKESALKFVAKDAKPEDSKMKNVAQQIEFEYPKYQHFNPSEQYSGSEYMDKPKIQSSYLPIDYKTNYLKQNALQKPTGSHQYAEKLQQSRPQLFYPNYGYNEASKEDYWHLFNEPQNGEIQKQEVPKKVEEYTPGYSYQNVVNGKSQAKPKATQDLKSVHNYETSIERKPQLYYTQKYEPTSVSKKEGLKPAVSYQTVINGQKSRFDNKQEKVNKTPTFSFTQEAEKQQINNIDLQNYELVSPYQSVDNGKSQDNSKKIEHKHQYETSINNQAKQQLYYIQQQQPKRDSNEEYLNLFNQPQNGKIQKQELSKKVEEHKPAYSYQNVVNGKSQANPKATQDLKGVHNYETSIESKPQLYYTQKYEPTSVPKKEGLKPAVSYQTVINGQKSRFGNKREKVNETPTFSFTQEGENQQIHNIDHQNYELASSYQSVDNGKSLEYSKKIKHQYETSINNQGKQQLHYFQQQQPKGDSNKEQQSVTSYKTGKQQLYYTQQFPEIILKREEQKPTFSYQTVINGQKLGNKQQALKYYQQPEKKYEYETDIMKQAQIQPLYAPYIYNTQDQENYKTKETPKFDQSAISQYYANLQKQYQNVQIPAVPKKESQKQVLNSNFAEEYYKPIDLQMHAAQPNFLYNGLK